MSVITDFFVATLDEVLQKMPLTGPLSLYPTVEGNRVDGVKVIQLQCILDGSSFDDHLSELDTLIIRGGDDEPLVVCVPDVIVQALAGASKQRLAHIATAWAATDEWQRDGGTAENLRPWLEEIAILANWAQIEGRSLFAWISV